MGKDQQVSCPFCGAPYGEIIPHNAVQVKCKYCGGIIVTPSFLHRLTNRCPNHADRIANEKCTDCGRSFCEECLNTYEHKTEYFEATLRLCRICLLDRHMKKAKGLIYAGVIWSIFGVAFAAIIPVMPLQLFWIIWTVAGLVMIFYGSIRRAEIWNELRGDISDAETSENRHETANLGTFNADWAYSKLLTYYVTHWGALTGTEFLNGELRAHTSRGITFEEAVQKIYKRQEDKLLRRSG